MVLPKKSASDAKVAVKPEDKAVEASEVPETTPETPQEEPQEHSEDIPEEEQEEVSLEQVAVNHEERLRSLEAAFFRLKNSL